LISLFNFHLQQVFSCWHS